jgi:hypothetical protein
LPAKFLILNYSLAYKTYLAAFKNCLAMDYSLASKIFLALKYSLDAPKLLGLEV